MKFEQFAVGQSFKTKPVALSKDELISFAENYDPQYFHINEPLAKESAYGGLIASGFHTIAKVWSEWIRMDVLGLDCLGGLSATDLTWSRPVFAGDELYAEVSVIEKALLNDKARGKVSFRFLIYNQKDKQVATLTANVLVASQTFSIT